MNILSLFDGISCGQIALERAGIDYENYYASEIDKYAIAVTQHHWPDTVQLGDVKKWREWELPRIDLLIGGSPCQGFSLAGKQLNFDDVRSKLFFCFVNILRHYKPRWFLLENVRMKCEYRDIISDYLGVEPVFIDSALVSAQHRRRLYWTNIPHVKLFDLCISPLSIIDYNDKSTNSESWKLWWRNNINHQLSRGHSCIINDSEKSIVLTTRQVRSWNGNLVRHSDGIRFVNPIECERLQTIPDNYTLVKHPYYKNRMMSKTQRYKMLGNGWTVDVIAHIFGGIR